MTYKIPIYLTLLLVLSPILLMISVLILLVMGRPIIFKQERIGLKRRPFVLYKFRTMDEGRITQLGRILRSTGLDELPQLLNMVKNEMTVVGPRPLTLFDIERLQWQSARYDLRWDVLPGISGISQLTQKCHPKITMCCDKYYAQNKGFCLDAKIILWSLAVPMFGKEKVKNLFVK